MLDKEEKDSLTWFLIIYAIVCVIGYFALGCASPPPKDTWLDDPSPNCCRIAVPEPDGPIDYFFYGLADFGKTVSILSIF